MRRRAVIAALAVLSVSGVACSGDARLPGEVVGELPAAATTPTTAAPECAPDEDRPDLNVRTYPPLDEPPAYVASDGERTVDEIRADGQLVVGVSGDTLLFGSRDPLNDVIEGFDIDVLKEVAIAIFGPSGEDQIVYRVITYAQRLPALEARDVDIVAHTMTINCRRWLRINFSSVYYQAGQKVLVKKGSGLDTIDDLIAEGARVCAPEGSTNIDEIRKSEYAGIEVIGKPDITDCLVAMQQGEADATTGDDTVLAGFAAQDPTTELQLEDAFTEEPYGLGTNKADVELTRFVNGVLRDITTSGRLADIAETWLVDTGALTSVDLIPAVPEPDYSRPLP